MVVRSVFRCFVVASLACGMLGVTGAAQAAEVFTIHLSPTGSDSNSGLSAGSPLKTLARAQVVLAAQAPQSDVEIRIKQGVYVAAPLVWNTYVPGHTITFLPIDYEYGEGIGGIAGRPVFRGNGAGGYWLSARLPSGHPDGATLLRFYYLQVERYGNGGLQLRGGTGQNAQRITTPTNAGVNRNTVFGMMFTELGSAYGSATGYGAVNLQNSSDNLIRNNHFVRIVNDSSERGLVHGVYAAHHSKRNHIVANKFSYVSGDPVRTRNDSNDTIAEDNTFTRSGSGASYSEWFCDAACVAAHPGHGRECASHGNFFRRNDTGTGYSGGSISLWALMPPGLDTTGGSGCNNEGQPRLRTANNT